MRLLFFCACRQGLADDEEAERALRGRAAARKRLLSICPGRWTRSGAFTYYAHCGARSNTLADAAEEIAKEFDLAFLSAKPAIPAVNRWNKLYMPMAWWCFAHQFFNIVVEAFAMVRQSQVAASEPDFISNVDAIGPMSEQMYRKVNKARWNKAELWLTQASTARSMSIAVTLFRAVLPLMGSFFKATRGNNAESMLCVVCSSTSPAHRALRDLKAMLAQPDDHAAWYVVKPWSPGLLHDTACSAWTLMGEIFMRCIDAGALSSSCGSIGRELGAQCYLGGGCGIGSRGISVQGKPGRQTGRTPR